MPLLALPLEIREYIYQLALTAADDGSIYTDTNIQHPFTHSVPAVQPPLTQTNSQLRREALGVFYHVNTIVIGLLNDNSVRIAQRWIAGNWKRFAAMRSVVLKVYPSFDGRALAYDEFRWHAHGPYWLRMVFRPRDGVAREMVAFRVGEVAYLPGVTEISGVVARLWSMKADGWLGTTVEMITAVFAERLDALGFDLSIGW